MTQLELIQKMLELCLHPPINKADLQELLNAWFMVWRYLEKERAEF